MTQDKKTEGEMEAVSISLKRLKDENQKLREENEAFRDILKQIKDYWSVSEPKSSALASEVLAKYPRGDK